MNSTQLKEKLRIGERIYGTAVVSPSVKWIGVIKQANLDFVFLDSEHIPMGRETLASLCTMYSASGIPTIVRIPSPDPFIACTTLDGDASAILAPYVETKTQVKELVGAVKYRPLKGEKLRKLLDGDEKLKAKLQNYIDDRCKNNLLFINIESQPAVNSLAELLSVPGIDGVIIGPHDLSCSMGIPEEYNNPLFEKVVTKIIKECNTRNLGIGIHLSEEPELQIKWARVGANIILHSSDISLFNKMLNMDIIKIKENLGGSIVNKKNNSIII